LTDRHAQIEDDGAAYFASHQSQTTDVLRTLERVNRVTAVTPGARVTVVGCGPSPQAIRQLLDHGYDASGVEPVAAYVDLASQFLGEVGRVTKGSAESLPVETESQDVVIMESVLEHVDSVPSSIAEAYRVLKPGGVLHLTTTNRLRFTPSGINGEFRVRFYNWFPPVVKESYVFRHLHYQPELANFTPRPAVHWFTFAELCALGRQGGFSTFYSFLDLIEEDTDPSVTSSRLKRWIVRNVRQHPWFRAAVLTQLGDSVFMHKRA
jgi:ubiquinone/menaquinone biosynthesis C-methylase UbiE